MTYDLAPQQPVVNNKALAWTVGVHALLFLLLFFLRYSIAPPMPTPVTDSGGLEVNLGTSDNGSGHDQPMNTKAPAPYQATVVYKAAVPTATNSNLPKEIVQSTDADAPEVDNTKHKGKVTPTVEEKKPKPQPKEKPKYTYAGATGPGGNSATQNAPGKGEGITHSPGDQGVPGGTPGATNYSGIPGNGNGGIRLSPSLQGREITPKSFIAEFNEGGTVIIHVDVDRNGNISNPYIKSTSNSRLNNIALDKLNNAHFSKSNSSEPEVGGDVTIIFKTH